MKQFSVKYLVIIKVIRQTSYKQFMGGIRNDGGDDTYTDQNKKRKKSVR